MSQSQHYQFREQKRLTPSFSVFDTTDQNASCPTISSGFPWTLLEVFGTESVFIAPFFGSSSNALMSIGKMM